MFWVWMTARIVANPISNVFQKSLTRQGRDPLTIVCVTHLLLSVVCLPSLFYLSLPVSPQFWWNIALCTVLNIAGNTLLVQAVKRSDLSLLGPINAYKPVVSLLPSFVLLHEVPSPLGLLGILLIAGGSYAMVDRAANSSLAAACARLASDRGVQFRCGALVVTALEAVFIKQALLQSSAWTTFAWWSVLGFVLALVIVLAMSKIRGRPLNLVEGPTGALTSVLLAITVGLMQLSTIVILASYQVGYSLALFQTSAIISVILGRQIFQEPRFARRLLGSLIMVTGSILIVVSK